MNGPIVGIYVTGAGSVIQAFPASAFGLVSTYCIAAFIVATGRLCTNTQNHPLCYLGFAAAFTLRPEAVHIVGIGPGGSDMVNSYTSRIVLQSFSTVLIFRFSAEIEDKYPQRSCRLSIFLTYSSKYPQSK